MLPGVGRPAELRTEGAGHENVTGKSMSLQWRSKAKALGEAGLGVFRMRTRGHCGWKGVSQVRVDRVRLEGWAGVGHMGPSGPGESLNCM